jgi:hypothetical protein
LPQKVLFFGSSKPENSLFETSSRVLELEWEGCTLEKTWLPISRNEICKVKNYSKILEKKTVRKLWKMLMNLSNYGSIIWFCKPVKCSLSSLKNCEKNDIQLNSNNLSLCSIPSLWIMCKICVHKV